MSDHTCPACGETYRGSAGHDCIGSPDDRIAELERRVDELEERDQEREKRFVRLIDTLQDFMQNLGAYFRARE